MPRTDSKIAFISCIEVVLMRKGSVQYNQVITELDTSYGMSFIDCYDSPEPLIVILKQVYRQDYDSVVDAIELELKKLVDMERKTAEFMKLVRD